MLSEELLDAHASPRGHGRRSRIDDQEQTHEPARLDGVSPGAPYDADVADRASLDDLTEEITACRACPRLVAWRERVAREKRASFRDDDYWGRPVPGFGDEHARILLVGLAPAAHGGNRTGRVFTGDRSGDWLFGALHRVGLANQPESVWVGDGLRLTDAYVAAAVRCAPPDNKPTPAERDRCQPFLEREVALLADLRVVVALGAFAYASVWRVLGRAGVALPTPRPRFGHAVEVVTPSVVILGCYHPSQQNTFTGRLTEPMLDAVLVRARELASA
jgi:uracil-DNA glycosylase family 4